VSWSWSTRSASSLSGSTARGQGGANRDLDILVVVPSGTHRRRVAQELYRRIDGLAVLFDILVATPDGLRKPFDVPSALAWAGSVVGNS
jgi:predicted nucleotidyltransferase